MPPLWGLTFVWLRFYTDATPTGLGLWCYPLFYTDATPMGLWCYPLFYTDATPTGLGLWSSWCFYTDATHTRFYLFRCYRCFLRSIPSPKIVGARSPRPDENIADASAPISLQGGRSLNIGRGNPAPTEPRRESYLKILLHTPDRDVTPTGFYGAGTYIATQMTHIRVCNQLTNPTF